MSPTSSVTEKVPEPLPETVAQTQAPPALASEAAAGQDAGNRSGLHETVEALLEEKIPQIPVNMGKAIEKIGDLKAMGLDYGYGPTSLVQWGLEHLYIDAGLQWGAAIVAATVFIRVFMFPFQLRASENMAKLAAITPLTKAPLDEMREAMKVNDQERAQAARKKQQRIYSQFDIKPVKSMIPLLGQGIIGFGAFRCLRGMAALPVPGMSDGGFLWLKDLTVPDPYCLVPVITGGIMYWVVKVRS
jgi:YidC/Oxa1 family membrane protein insertase